MADNVLRVGAEFDVSQIIAGTEKAIIAFDQLGTAAAQQAAKFLQSGMSIADATSALQNLGYKSRESAAAVQQASAAISAMQAAATTTAEATAQISSASTDATTQIAALTDAVDGATTALLGQSEAAQVAADAITEFYAKQAQAASGAAVLTDAAMAASVAMQAQGAAAASASGNVSGIAAAQGALASGAVTAATSVNLTAAALNRQGVAAQGARATLAGLAAAQAAAAAGAAAGATATAAAAAATATQAGTAQAASSGIRGLIASILAWVTATSPAVAASNAATAALNNQAQAAANTASKLTALETAEASGAVRIAAMSAGAGGLGFALGRVATQSETLGRILAATFPLIGIAAFADIIVLLSEKVYHAYQNVVLLKDAIDSLDKAAEKEAERAASLNEQYDQTNAHLLEQQRNFIGAADTFKKAASEKPLTLFQIDDKNFKQFSADFVTFMQAVHTTADAPTVLTRIQAEAKSTKDQLDAATAALANTNAEIAKMQAAGQPAGIAPLIQTHQAKEVEDLTSKLGILTTAIGQVQSQTGITSGKLTEQLTSVSKAAAAQEAKDAEARVNAAKETGLAQIASDIETAKSRYSLQQISLAEETSLIADAEKRKLAIETSADEQLIAIKQRQAKKDPTLDVQPEITALIAKETSERIKSSTDALAASTRAEVEMRRQALETATSEIEANLRISESYLKLQEAKQRIAFEKAETPEEVLATSIPLIQTVTELYEKQAKAKEDEAAAVLKTVPANVPKPTAPVGTEDFGKQLEAMEALAPKQADELRKLNAEEIALRNEGAAAVAEIEKKKQDMLDKIRGEELDNTIRQLGLGLEAEKERYESGLTALQAQLAQRMTSLENFYAAEKALDEKSYADQVAIYTRQIEEIRTAAQKGVINQEQASKRIMEVYQKEAAAHEQMVRREEQQAKQAIDKEEQDIKTVTTKIASDFTQAFNQVITGHERVGQAAAKLGANLVLGIIDEGIKKVVTKYATELLTMIASHSSFLSHILGIETAGNAAKATIDQQKAASTAATDVGEVISYAAVGAAAAAAAAAAAGPEASAAAAADAESEILSFIPEAATTYERGGIVPGLQNQSVPILAHGQEMVLPAPISTFVQTAATRFGNTTSSKSQTSGGGDTHNHFNLPTNIGNLKAWDGASVRDALMEHGDLVGSIAIAAVKRHFRRNGGTP